MASLPSIRRFRQYLAQVRLAENQSVVVVRPRVSDRRPRRHSLCPAEVELLECRAMLAAQIVTPIISDTPLIMGQQLVVTLTYDVQAPAANAPIGLGLRLHYDSNVLQFDSLSNVLQDGFSTSEDRLEDVNDGNIRTDRIVNVLWLKLAGDWPNDSLPASLLTAQFTALASVDSSAVNFTAETSPGYGFTSTSVAIDNVAPTVTVDIADASLSDADNSSVVTFEFSEAVTGFAANDVTVNNGTLSNFSTVDSNTYTATFTANDGVVATGSVSVDSSSYTDAAGNTGSSGADNVSIETLNPTVIVNIVDAMLSDSDNSTNVTFEFSETVFGFTVGDITVSGGMLSDLAPIDGDSYTATFTATDGTNTVGSVSVGASSYTDSRGNAGSSGSDNVTIDTLNPTVVITPDETTTSDSPIVFTFQFSEMVSGFVSGDVSITNGSAGTFTPVDGDTFTLEVTPAAPGTVTVSIAAGVAQDAAGNDNTSGSASVARPGPAEVTLPGGGTYEVLIVGGDLVVRVSGGAEQFRRSATSVTKLQITGSAGDDTVTVLNSGGAVAIPIFFSGARGADKFNASLATGSVTLLGGSGNDTLTGGSSDDLIFAGSGFDTVNGGAGNDLIFGNSGRDSLSGDSGNDTIFGGRGRDSIEGGQDADNISGGGGPDTIHGNEGSDFLRGGAGLDLIDGDDGADTLVGSGGADNLAGGLGNDTLNGIFRDDAFNQVVGRDTLIGGNRPGGHPAPIQATANPQKDPAIPSFMTPQVDNEDIDELFEGPLLPELLAS